MDPRERVLAAVDRGMPRAEAVRTFGISLATIKRYLKRRRETDDVAPKKRPGMAPRIGKTVEQRRALWERLEAHDEATLEHHCDLWERGQGARVSVSTMSRAIRRLGWILKKRRPSHRARRRSARCLARADSTARSEAAGVRGRSEAGGSNPAGSCRQLRCRGKNTTLLAALSAEGMGAAMAVEGATTSAAFEVYAEHFLAPMLGEGQVIVVDNPNAHEEDRVRELVEAEGASVLFLPAYSSPDFSPIEEAFSKVKAILRRAEARSREALQEQRRDVKSGKPRGWRSWGGRGGIGFGGNHRNLGT